MKIATNNRLAHLQVEYDETLQQSQVLMNQQVFKNQELAQLVNYLNFNAGDRNARQRYRDLVRELNHIQSELRKNDKKLVSLQRRIGIEGANIQTNDQGYYRYGRR